MYYNSKYSSLHSSVREFPSLGTDTATQTPPLAATSVVPKVTVSHAGMPSNEGPAFEFSHTPNMEEQDRFFLSDSAHHNYALSVGSRPIRSNSLTPTVGSHKSGEGASSFWDTRPSMKHRSHSITFGVKDHQYLANSRMPGPVPEHPGMRGELT